MKIENEREDLFVRGYACVESGRSLAKEVYLMTSQGRLLKDFGLRDQMQRAVVSIVPKIAERFERNNTKEFITFLRYSKGSVAELRTQLLVAADIGYINQETYHELSTPRYSISRQLSGLITYLLRDDEASRNL